VGLVDGTASSPSRPGVLEIGADPTPLHTWLQSIWAHRAVLWILARKDFQVRYKRASLGVLWAVAVPLVQAAVLAIVFSRIVPVRAEVPFGLFVFSGVVAWSYFSATTQVSVSAIVDAAALTDKVWFPRGLLAVVPCMANLVGFAVSALALVALTPVLGGHLSAWLLVLLPATLLLILFTVALALVLSALDVYFRDVKFLTMAAFLVWLYLTPVVYPQEAVGQLGKWLDFNPMTGVVNLFHLAVLGPFEDWHRSVVVTVVATIVLLVIGAEIHRRHDRLFVDLL
jgi:lipopolysaccharide transport system permease protein